MTATLALTVAVQTEWQEVDYPWMSLDLRFVVAFSICPPLVISGSSPLLPVSLFLFAVWLSHTWLGAYLVAGQVQGQLVDSQAWVEPTVLAVACLQTVLVWRLLLPAESKKVMLLPFQRFSMYNKICNICKTSQQFGRASS